MLSPFQFPIISILFPLSPLQVCHMEDTLAALTQALLGPTTLTAATTSTTSGEVDEACYSNLHRGLQTLLEIVPRAAAQLVSALNKHYPFRTRGPDIQVYIYSWTSPFRTHTILVSEGVLRERNGVLLEITSGASLWRGLHIVDRFYCKYFLLWVTNSFQFWVESTCILCV